MGTPIEGHSVNPVNPSSVEGVAQEKPWLAAVNNLSLEDVQKLKNSGLFDNFYQFESIVAGGAPGGAAEILRLYALAALNKEQVQNLLDGLKVICDNKLFFNKMNMPETIYGDKLPKGTSSAELEQRKLRFQEMSNAVQKRFEDATNEYAQKAIDHGVKQVTTGSSQSVNSYDVQTKLNRFITLFQDSYQKEKSKPGFDERVFHYIQSKIFDKSFQSGEEYYLTQAVRSKSLLSEVSSQERAMIQKIIRESASANMKLRG